MITTKSPREIEYMREAGRIVGLHMLRLPLSLNRV